MVGYRSKLYCISLLSVSVFSTSTQARSLDDAVESMINYVAGEACHELKSQGGNPVGDLAEICSLDFANGNADSVSGSSGGSAVFNGAGKKLTSKQSLEQGESSESSSKAYSSELALGSHWSVFSTLQDGFLDRYATETENGYKSDLHRFDVGGFYTPNAKSSWGVALNYEKHTGEYLSGGDFNKQGVGATFVGAYYPTANWHIDGALGVKQVNSQRKREAEFSYELNGVAYFPVESTPETDFDYLSTAFNLSSGYHFQFNALSVSPLAGLAYSLDDYGSYSEKNGKGLGLVFHDDKQKSLQAIAGVEASYVIPSKVGVFIPRASVSWHHEFESAARDVTISFVDDAAGVKFNYQTDPLDKNFGMALMGVSGQFPHGVHVFGDVQTMFSHRFYKNTVAVLGISKEL